MPNKQSSEKRFYVYAHHRATDGLLFYIGKGTRGRAFSHHNRNSYWKKIVGKHGFVAKIVSPLMSAHCAFTLERIMMAANWHPRMANVSLGGDGTPYHSVESRAKMSASLKGRKYLPGARIKAFEKRGKPIINSDGEIFPTSREAQRVLEKRWGRKISSGALSGALNGKHAHVYGLKWSFDTSKVPESPLPENYGVPFECIETGEIFSSLTDAVNALKERRGKSSSGLLSDAANKGRKAYGFHWRYVQCPTLHSARPNSASRPARK